MQPSSSSSALSSSAALSASAPILPLANKNTLSDNRTPSVLEPRKIKAPSDNPVLDKWMENFGGWWAVALDVALTFGSIIAFQASEAVELTHPVLSLSLGLAGSAACISVIVLSLWMLYRMSQPIIIIDNPRYS